MSTLYPGESASSFDAVGRVVMQGRTGCQVVGMGEDEDAMTEHVR